MADLDVSNPTDGSVVAQFPSNARDSRAAALALFAGTAWWGGTAGGTADALTVTVSNTGLTLTSGLRVLLILSDANATTTPTLTVNALSATTITARDGGALAAGELVSGQMIEVIYDGTNFRLLTGGGLMNQTLYDALLPVGFVQMRSDGTAPVVPDGVTATWTEVTSTVPGYGRAISIDNNDSAGAKSGSDSQALSHTHGAGTYAVSGTTGTPSENTDGADGTGRPSATHTHSFSASVTGTSAANSSESVEFDISRYIVRAYERTA